MTEILKYEFSSLAELNNDATGTFDTTVATGTGQVTDVGSSSAYGLTAHFNGSTSLEMSTVPTTLTDNSARSLSVWIYSTANNAEQRILSTASGTGITIFQKRTDNRLGLQNTTFGTLSSSTIPLNTWTHVGFTYNGSNSSSVYINGSVEATSTWAMNLSSLDMKFIGATGTGPSFFNGNMLDFRLYDTELSSTEMGTLYTNGPVSAGVIDPEPILWYKLNEDSTNIGTDSSSNANHMTNVGVVSVNDSENGSVADFSSGTLTLASASVPSSLYGNSSRSFSFWIESGVEANTQIIDIGTRNVTGRDFGVAVNGSQKIGCTFFNITGLQSTTVMTSGTWYHVTITFESSTNAFKIYINGALETTGTKNMQTTQTDFEIGELGTQNMRLLDFRVYGETISDTFISTVYVDGPDQGPNVSATMYSNAAYCTWTAISGATNYTLFTKENVSGDLVDKAETTELSTEVYNLDDGVSYDFELYTDLNLTTPSLSTEGNTTPAIGSSSVGDLVTFTSNDLTKLDEDIVEEIDEYLKDSLNTGDIVKARVSCQNSVKQDKNISFVQSSETISIEPNQLVLTPFTDTGVASSSITLGLSDSTTQTITFDQANNQVTVASTTYDIGDVFIIDGKKCVVSELN